MNEFVAKMEQPVITGKDGQAILKLGHLLGAGVGALVLYLAVPERKRRNLFK